MVTINSSRSYAEYRQQLRQRRKDKSDSKDKAGGESPRPRSRSFGRLLWEFVLLLRGHWWAIGFALATLTVSTLLRLAPPLATKIVIDNILTDRPLPAAWTEQYGLPTDRFRLLYVIGGAIAAVSLLATLIHLSAAGLPQGRQPPSSRDPPPRLGPCRAAAALSRLSAQVRRGDEPLA